MSRELLPEVTTIAGLLELDRPVPLPILRACMNSEEPEALGIAYAVVSEHCDAIDGDLPPDEVLPFCIRYLEKCIRENPEGEFSHSRYTAAHALVGWYRYIRGQGSISQEYPQEVRRMLRRIYENGDAGVRQAVIDGVLEHLFEDDSIIAEFDDWRTNPHLRAGYNSALAWSKGRSKGS